MRRFLTLIAAAFISGTLFAGGLVTNTNQSASWVRLPARNASVNIDAVYYNPAGLMKLDNGLHFSVSNQTIFQTKEVENFYAGPGGTYGLNENLYVGKVKAPFFPSIYAAYKMDKLAFSLGFNPVGGGGGALYEKGLPSFEMSASDLVPALASMGATGYRLDAFLEGTSVFFGFQGGVSYKVNDFLSIAAGLRYVTAKNTYLGHLQDIEINLPSGWTRADLIMTGIAGQATTAATSTTALVNGGAGSLTLAQAEAATVITTAQRLALEGALSAFGSPTSVTISQADAVFKGAAATYTATATLLGDQEVDVEQTGTGYTPFFSVNISPSDALNIGIKYEMATKLELKNSTKLDFLTGFTSEGVPVTMFPDGALTRNDMPAMLAVGIDVKPVSSLKISLGSNYFFDKTANYGRALENSEIIDQNGFSIQGGLEYNISGNFLVSGGYVYANKGVNSKYQNDLTYGLATHTVGAGGAFSISDNFRINFGASYTKYVKDEQTISHVFAPLGLPIPALETYAKKTMVFGVGLDLSF